MTRLQCGKALGHQVNNLLNTLGTRPTELINLFIRQAAMCPQRDENRNLGAAEVAYFLDTFMDSFSLTLDQLKSPGDPQESCGERKA